MTEETNTNPKCVRCGKDQTVGLHWNADLEDFLCDSVYTDTDEVVKVHCPIHKEPYTYNLDCTEDCEARKQFYNPNEEVDAEEEETFIVWSEGRDPKRIEASKASEAAMAYGNSFGEEVLLPEEVFVVLETDAVKLDLIRGYATPLDLFDDESIPAEIYLE